MTDEPMPETEPETAPETVPVPDAEPASDANATAEAADAPATEANAADANAGETATEPPATDSAADSAAHAAGEAHGPSSGLTLYMLRHADAGDPMQWAGDDWDRPLSNKGRRQSKRLGQHLDALHIRPDAIVTSPRVRAAETAKGVAKRIGATVMTDDRLAGGFSEFGLQALVRELDPGVASVMLVGHDPDFSVIASWLVGAHVGLVKGSLAVIELADRGSLAAGSGELHWLLPPDAVAR